MSTLPGPAADGGAAARPVDASDLLDAWERGARASPGERGLLLLRLACPELAPASLSAWSVGRRDGALLALRERAFGRLLAAVVVCPACAEPSEIEFLASDVLVPATSGHQASSTVAQDGCRVTFRLPTAGDLAGIGAGEGGEDPERWLLERCVEQATSNGRAADVADLPAGVVDAVVEAMAGADPQAEIELALCCPSCDERWTAAFDIVGFLWREVEARAARILAEVAGLAMAFGWSERAILAMSAWRRRQYLEVAQA